MQTPAPTLTLTIDAVAYGGKGVARVGGAGGKVFFVQDAVQGDTVKARITENGERYGEAVVEEILTPSPLRGPSPCKFAGECGGCQWMGVDYATQLGWKKGFVESALKRIGKLEDVAVEMIGSPEVLGYRNRILVRGHHDGREHVALGYFARASRSLVPIDSCQIAEPRVNEALRAIQGISVADLEPFKVRCEVQRVPGEKAFAPGVVVTIHPADGSKEAIKTFTSRVAALPGVLWCGDFAAAASAPLVKFEDDLDVSFQTLPGQFQQVNVALNHTLRRLVTSLADRVQPERILDVFCGSGNLTLPLARPGRYVEGVEMSRKAIDVARASAQANGRDVTFLAGDAEKHLWKCARGGERFDLILLDPPRTGMYKGMVPLKKLAPDHIVYVSCDPTTLARDLGYLCRGDAYKIESVTALDFFPNTFHVETVVVLRRS